jgi:S-sulfo-L-cysteine synthase (O-acetyl-L-serine-dependent)
MESLIKRYSGTDLITKVRSIENKVGSTPLHAVRKLYQKKGIQIFAKKEWMQLSGSVKARAGYAIIRNAIETGKLVEGKSLLDATSGNTGIAYATIGKLLGIPVTLCLPENATLERKEILRGLGAELILTSKYEGTDGAQQEAKTLSRKFPDKYFYADQYKNENNWKAHYHTTALEIFEEIPSITHFVAALGTTGTFVGTGRRLRKLNPDIELISLQPDSALHGLEGWKHLETAIVPAIYDPTVADKNLDISTEEAYEMIRRAKDEEGLLLSPSSAANLVGAIKVASELEKGIIVTVLPDNGDKYSEVLRKIL